MNNKQLRELIRRAVNEAGYRRDYDTYPEEVPQNEVSDQPSIQPYVDAIAGALDGEYALLRGKIAKNLAEDVGQNIEDMCVLPTSEAEIEQIVKNVQSEVVAKTEFVERLARSLVRAALEHAGKKSYFSRQSNPAKR